MKKLRFLLPFLILAGLVAALIGCTKTAPLSRPTGVTVDETSLTLNWKQVPGARRYVVRINGTDKNTAKNSYSLVGLQEGEYELKVKACPETDAYDDSDWSVAVRFVREHEPGFAFTLVNGNKEYEVSGAGTADGNAVIPDVYRGKPVTSVGEKAFASVSKLTSVTLGANVARIGALAFAGCKNLERVVWNENLTEIAEKAFQSCGKLTEVSLPDKVTVIGENAFNYCEGIQTLSLGAGVKEIGNAAFANCKSIERIAIPDNVERLGEYAFSACSAATSLKTGDGIAEIGAYAFFKCTALADIAIGARVEKIGNFAFSECRAVTHVALPDSVTAVGLCAFLGCENLADVTLGANVRTILTGAFMDTALWNASDPMVYAGNWLLGIKNTAGRYEAADFKTGLYGIASSAFSACKATQVTLPNSVKILSDYAFDGCENLFGVVIGSGVTHIASYAFNECEKLTSVVLGSYDYDNRVLKASRLESIGAYAFNGCTALVGIEVPETVKSIGANAFNGCSALQSADIPASVTSVGADAFKGTYIWENTSGIVYAGKWAVGYRIAPGVQPDYDETIRLGTVGIADYAFYNVTTVTGIDIPDTVKYIGRGAFYNCENLTKAALPAGLERIEDYTFYKCKFLMDVNLYYIRNLKYIGRSAFYQCELVGLSENSDTNNVIFRIPDSVEEIGDYAFYKCGRVLYDEEGEIEKISGVNTLIFGSGVKRIGSFAFYRFVSLKTVLVGASVESIGEKAFYKCENLEVVSLGDNLETIGDRAFYGCAALKKVSVPDSVHTVGHYAFAKCSAMTELSLGNGVRTIGNYAFYGCESLRGLRLSQNVSQIGKQAFRNCALLESVAIASGVTELGAHVFYGCTDLTIYAEATSAPQTWHARWNSSYRPTVWGVTLSDDKSYVISFVKTADGIARLYDNTVIRAPYREGYTFEGWTDVPGGAVAKYTAEGIVLAPNDGTVWYAVWKEIQTE